MLEPTVFLPLLHIASLRLSLSLPPSRFLLFFSSLCFSLSASLHSSPSSCLPPCPFPLASLHPLFAKSTSKSGEEKKKEKDGVHLWRPYRFSVRKTLMSSSVSACHFATRFDSPCRTKGVSTWGIETKSTELVMETEVASEKEADELLVHHMGRETDKGRQRKR